MVYVVRGGAILNDATIEDAFAAGIEHVAEIKTTGYRGLGVIFKHSSSALKLWDEAPLIIAKGMANYETLSDQGSRLFFLLQVKCDPSAGISVRKPAAWWLDAVGLTASPPLVDTVLKSRGKLN